MEQTALQIGRGTPVGDELRRWWIPIAVAGEVTQARPIRPVRVLSEGLVLFRGESGRVGLIQERCTHHGVLLFCGHVEDDRVVCPLHAWRFDAEGNCSAIGWQGKVYPMSWAEARAHPVQEYAGLYWAYLGSPPAPALPAHDVLARRDGRRRITVYPELSRGWMDGDTLIQPDPRADCLWLRAPIDDTRTWQVKVELMPSQGDALIDPAGEGLDVIYLPESGKP